MSSVNPATRPAGPEMNSTELYLAAHDSGTGCEAACRIRVTTPGPLPDLSGLASRIARDVRDLAALREPAKPVVLAVIAGRWSVSDGSTSVVIARTRGVKKVEATVLRRMRPTPVTMALLAAWLRARGERAPDLPLADRHLLPPLRRALSSRVVIRKSRIDLATDVCLHESALSLLLRCFPSCERRLSWWRATGLIVPSIMP